MSRNAFQRCVKKQFDWFINGRKFSFCLLQGCLLCHQNNFIKTSYLQVQHHTTISIMPTLSFIEKRRISCFSYNQTIMIENSKVIPEAEQPLQQSFMMSPALKKEKESTPAIKELSRDVDKLISRFPSQFSQLQTSEKLEFDNNMIQKEATVKNQEKYSRSFISKYNYTGKHYRFEEAQKLLNIEKPNIEKSKTQEPKERLPSEAGSVYNNKDSILAEDSFERSEVKFPSQNYYLVFDRKNKKEKTDKYKDHENLAKTVYLEKKVKKLEEQMKEMKFNAARTSGSFKKDGRIKLQKFLESMIG